MILVALGLIAGLTTTVAGMGRGTLLVLALALLYDPLSALALSTPALLAGNLHRVALYRRQIVWSEARPLVLGGFLAAAVGGFVAAGLPGWLIQSLMLGMAVLALGQALGLPLKPPAQATLPVAGVVGLVSATSGGGGLIAGPYLLARGLSGVPYVATGALGAAAVHVGKLGAYSTVGVSSWDTLGRGLALAVCHRGRQPGGRAAQATDGRGRPKDPPTAGDGRLCRDGAGRPLIASPDAPSSALAPRPRGAR